MKIAVGGFQHETNTFAKALTTYADFDRALARRDDLRRDARP
jgi:microcystin degradation protein MlrC